MILRGGGGERRMIHHGDCLDVLRTLPDASVDACVTDPPYGLSFMGKKWDYDVPAVEVWAECLRVLKPGGHLLAFAGTRTQHRMAVRIEDAGFEIRDMIVWVYGSGFPKSVDVSKVIDKAAGAEREVVGPNVWADRGGLLQANTYGAPSRPEATAPATNAARQWQGWGTALKPALEPITVARKPLDGTVAENVLRYGTGGLNIDGCRVGTEATVTVCNGNSGAHGRYGKDDRVFTRDNPPGRWPANLIHDGSEEAVNIFAGSEKNARVYTPTVGFDDFSAGAAYNAGWRKHKRSRAERNYYDPGSAARFFYCAKASKADREEGLAHFPAKRKAGAEFRPNHMENAEQGESGNPYGRWNETKNTHPTVKPTDLMRYLVRLVTPPGGVVLDPFMGSGSTGKACALEGFQFIGIEREAEYVEIARCRIDNAKLPLMRAAE